MIYSSKKHYILPTSIILIIALVVLFNLFIKPNLIISTVSEVYPLERWILTKGNSDQIISSLIDYSYGNRTNYNLHQFERGEHASFYFNPNKFGDKFIQKGDTVLSIHSTSISERIIDAEGQLEIAEYDLKSKSSGEKYELIKEAELRIKYADEKINELNVLLEREKVLFEKGLSSKQDYETSLWILELQKIEKSISELQLENLNTGVKKEEIDLIESRIRAAKSKLKYLKENENNMHFVAPISGFVGNTFSSDTLLLVTNDEYVILNTPVAVGDISLLNRGETINFSFDDNFIYKGEIVSISREVKYLNSKQVVEILIKVENSDGKLLPGMLKQSNLILKEITFFEYLKRLILT